MFFKLTGEVLGIAKTSFASDFLDERSVGQENARIFQPLASHPGMRRLAELLTEVAAKLPVGCPAPLGQGCDTKVSLSRFAIPILDAIETTCHVKSRGIKPTPFAQVKAPVSTHLMSDSTRTFSR